METQSTTVTFALYQDITYPGSTPRCHVYSGDDGFPEGHGDYVRVSEYVDVTIHPRNESERAQDMLKRLLTQRVNTEIEAKERLDSIDRQIEELRALPAPTQAA